MLHCEYCGRQLHMVPDDLENEFILVDDAGEQDCETAPYGIHEIGE